MEKYFYQTPNLSIILSEDEDVICTSADTDAPFGEDSDVYGDDIFD